MPDLVPAVVPEGRLRNQPQPTLQIDELTLRPWRLSDAEAVVDAYSDPAIQQWHARSMTPDEAVDWLASWSSQWHAETGVGWAITQTDSVVGRVAFRSIDLGVGIAEIAYWTMPAARGRNIAARAARTVSTWMFSSVGINRLELSHSALNSPSCRIAEKAGFSYEGNRRRQRLHQDGWHDMHLHARLASDELSGKALQ